MVYGSLMDFVTTESTPAIQQGAIVTPFMIVTPAASIEYEPIKTGEQTSFDLMTSAPWVMILDLYPASTAKRTGH